MKTETSRTRRGWQGFACHLLNVRQETSAFNMFPSDPLKNVGYRIIYTSVVIHGLGLAGLIGGSPIRHIAGIVGALIWSL